MQTRNIKDTICPFSTEKSLFGFESEKRVPFSAKGVVQTTFEHSRDDRTTADGFACSVFGGIGADELNKAFTKLFLLGKFARAS